MGLSSMKKIDNFIGEYRFLSNSYPDGPGSFEHLIQAFRCARALDAVNVLKAETPAEAIKLADTFKIRRGWDQNKYEIMYELVKIKFQNIELRCRLIETGDAELINQNTWGETYWGVCAGRGENHLGKILMKIRKELRS